MGDVKDTFVDSPIDQGNINWEKYYVGIEEHEKLWSYKKEHDGHVKFFLKHYNFPSNITILDSGCGEGKNTKLLTELYDNVYGVDISQTAINNVSKVFPEVKFSAQDVADLNFTDNMFDVIIDAGCMHTNHPMQHQKIVNQYHRILKPNGKLFFRLFFTPDDNNEHPIFWFDCDTDQFVTPVKGKMPVYGLNQKTIEKLIHGLFTPDEILFEGVYGVDGVHFIYFSKINI